MIYLTYIYIYLSINHTYIHAKVLIFFANFIKRFNKQHDIVVKRKSNVTCQKLPSKVKSHKVGETCMFVSTHIMACDLLRPITGT